MNPHPYQTAGVDAALDVFDRGLRRACLTSPTGGGKTLMMKLLIERFVNSGRQVVLYTNRRTLVQQLSADMVDSRISHGVRAAGYEADLAEPFQISSIQTEASRVLKRGSWSLHAQDPADLAIFDEGHLHTNGQALEIRRRHLAGGAFTLDVTATPLGMGGVCDEIVVAGTNSVLREAGMILPCYHYAPDEPDWRELKTLKTEPAEGEDLSENQQRKLMGGVDKAGRPDRAITSLYGRVWHHFQRLNPDRRATLCFAPGVRESLWLAQQFEAMGVPAASIDSTQLWRGGESFRRTDDRWQELLDDWKAGRVVVVCSRFVLREGVNAPWIGHGIMATCFGGVQSYIQSGGRLLRSYSGMDRVTLQDHGGNYWRHGSLNVDRVWSLDDTARAVFARRADAIREKRERPPVVCPQCGQVLNRSECPCGYVVKVNKLPRAVFTAEGEQKLMNADYFPARRRTSDPSLIRDWTVVWRRACSVTWNATWAQAEAGFCREHEGLYPSRSWPLMPLYPAEDIGRRVIDTPVDRLRGDPDMLARMRVYQDNQLAKLRRLEDGKGQDAQAGEEAPAALAAEDGAGQERQD